MPNNPFRIGRGTKMSIAKAALVFFYSDHDIPTSSLNYGNLNDMHDIVDIAGAQHQSALTPAQVMSCLRTSPYWKCEFCPGYYSGFRGHGGASIAVPTEKGRKYYEEKLKGEKSNG